MIDACQTQRLTHVVDAKLTRVKATKSRTRSQYIHMRLGMACRLVCVIANVGLISSLRRARVFHYTSALCDFSTHVLNNMWSLVLCMDTVWLCDPHVICDMLGVLAVLFDIGDITRDPSTL